ncbi:zeta toxin family protein [Streptomyces sp. NPDC048281]|uniref:zeta toxin family protein n=1 Tax=Streptomyces sp. NPDC048281 TaxID=3154715 RepID=UPI00343D63B1
MPEESMTARYARVQKYMAELAYAYNSMSLNGEYDWAQGPRHSMHSRIIDNMAAGFERIPRTQDPILICTAGPGGVGKSTSLQNGLQMLNDKSSDLGRSLNELAGNPENGVTSDSFVVLNHEIIKEAIWCEGGLDYIPERYRQQLSPAEMSSAVHEESSWVMERVADVAMERGHNIAYEISMQNLPATRGLLEYFESKGYGQRIALSVEEPRDVAIYRNGDRWMKGYSEFKEKKEAGELVFGNTLTPQFIIESAYQTSNEWSDCRQNVDHLAREGWITAVIEVDQGDSTVLNRAALVERWEMQAAEEHAWYEGQAAYMRNVLADRPRPDSPPPPYAEDEDVRAPSTADADPHVARFAAMNPSIPPRPGAEQRTTEQGTRPPGTSRPSTPSDPRGQPRGPGR